MTLRDLKPSELKEFSQETFKVLHKHYGYGSKEINTQVRETRLWKAWFYMSHNLEPCAGYHTNMHRHDNIIRQRLKAIVDGVLDGINTTTMIKHCSINGKKFSAVDVFDEICPILNMSSSINFNNQTCSDLGQDPKTILQRIHDITSDIEDKVGTHTLFELLANNMGINNPTNIVASGRVKAQILTVLLKQKINWTTLTQCILDKYTWRIILKSCKSVDVDIECEDTSKDFCGEGQIGFGTVVIAAVFLPGLIQAIGNIIFYKVSSKKYIHQSYHISFAG